MYKLSNSAHETRTYLDAIARTQLGKLINYRLDAIFLYVQKLNWQSSQKGGLPEISIVKQKIKFVCFETRLQCGKLGFL